MCTVLDDGLSALHGALSAKVGHTLFGHDDVHVVLRMVVVRHHGYDGTDFSLLGYRRAGEDGDVGIACEVATSTDTVHHLGASDVSRVDVAVDVCFNSGVDRDDTQSAGHFGAIADFARAEDEFVAEEVDVIVDAVQAIVCHGERAGASEFHTAGTDEVNHRILKHFGVHFKGRYGGVASQGSQYGVGNVAHTTLQGQEGRRDDAASHVCSQEVGHVLSDFVRDGVGCGKGTCFVGFVHFHNTHNLGRVDLYVGSTDAVAGLEDGDFATIGRVEWFIHVVQSDAVFAMCRVQLDNHLVGHTGNGG